MQVTVRCLGAVYHGAPQRPALRQIIMMVTVSIPVQWKFAIILVGQQTYLESLVEISHHLSLVGRKKCEPHSRRQIGKHSSSPQSKHMATGSELDDQLLHAQFLL